MTAAPFVQVHAATLVIHLDERSTLKQKGSELQKIEVNNSTQRELIDGLNKQYSADFGTFSSAACKASKFSFLHDFHYFYSNYSHHFFNSLNQQPLISLFIMTVPVGERFTQLD